MYRLRLKRRRWRRRRLRQRPSHRHRHRQLNRHLNRHLHHLWRPLVLDWLTSCRVPENGVRDNWVCGQWWEWLAQSPLLSVSFLVVIAFSCWLSVVVAAVMLQSRIGRPRTHLIGYGKRNERRAKQSETVQWLTASSLYLPLLLLYLSLSLTLSVSVSVSVSS